MSKYFIVETVDLLITILENGWEYATLKSKYKEDIEQIEDLISYNDTELKAGNYETSNFKIKVVEKFINKNTSVFVYECETK